MAKDNRIRAAKHQRSLARRVLLFSCFLLICIVGVIYFWQLSDKNEPENQGAVQNLPIMPDLADGLHKQTWVTLYFRHGETPYLTAQHRRIDVAAGESLETAALNSLAEGPGASRDLTALLPRGTKVLRTESIGDTLYVNFNAAIADWPIDNPNVAAREAKLRLIAQAIANTAIDCGHFSRVQILVEEKTPLRRDFGFDADNEKGSDALEALPFSADFVLDAKRTLEICLNAVKNRDWKTLYDQLVDSDGALLLDYESMRKQWEEQEYRISSWKIDDYRSGGANDASEIIHVDLHYYFEDGRSADRPGVPVKMLREKDTWKLPIDALERLLTLPQGVG